MRIPIIVGFLLLSLNSQSQKLFDNSSISHFSCGYFIGSLSSSYFGKTSKERLIVGTVTGLSAGLIKEIIDHKNSPKSGNFGDLLSTTTGAFIGSMVVNFVVNKSSKKKKYKNETILF
jgi:uncharacterized membrane protein YeaQ/YmgE (transglycosylase-associated protein family)